MVRMTRGVQVKIVCKSRETTSMRSTNLEENKIKVLNVGTGPQREFMTLPLDTTYAA